MFHRHVELISHGKTFLPWQRDHNPYDLTKPIPATPSAMLARNMARFVHHSSVQDAGADEDHVYLNNKLAALRTLRNANVTLLSEVLEIRETCGSNLEVN